MTTREKARDYIWSRIETTEREYRQINNDMRTRSTGVLTMDQLEIRLDATDRKLHMYNYLFKLIELDED